MTKNRRLPPEARTAQLLDVALKLAARHGLANIRRDQIAEAAKVSQGIVTLRLGSVPAMRRSVMRAAVDREVLPVIAEGIVARDKVALKASPDLQKRALAALAA